MIAKMKKLTLFVPENAREDFLFKLRSLGLVHIKHAVKPSRDEMTSLEGTIDQIKKVVSIFKGCCIPKEAEKIIWKTPEIPERAREAAEAFSEREELLKNLQYLENRMEQFKPWGAFDPKDLHGFEGKGIAIRLYRTTKRLAQKLIQEKKDVYIINQDKQYAYVAQVCEAHAEGLSIEEVKFPQESFDEIYDKHETYKKKIEEIEDDLRAKARASESLSKYLGVLEDRHAFLNVLYGMKEEAHFSYLQGFCPQESVKKVAELAGQSSCGYFVEEPDDPEETPTLIRNPRWINIISPVFKFMNTIPGYKECDISFFFLTFFSLFFAILIGDAGYGIVFLASTMLARRKLKKAPAEPFFLMYVLSVATIIWGAITGTWFGAEKIAQLPVLNSLVIDRINSFAAGNQDFMIYICLVIAVVHLTIAHLIVTFRIINTLKALSEIGWLIILWALFFTAGTLLLNRPFPAIGKYLFAAGVALVFFFSNPPKDFVKGLPLTIMNLPLKTAGFFADIVSYLRLFAVSSASFIIADMLTKGAQAMGASGFLASVGAAIVLVLGHLLNIVLGVLAVVVHGIRLNILEFSGHIGMEWTGKEYKPFSENGG